MPSRREHLLPASCHMGACRYYIRALRRSGPITGSDPWPLATERRELSRAPSVYIGSSSTRTGYIVPTYRRATSLIVCVLALSCRRGSSNSPSDGIQVLDVDAPIGLDGPA